MLPLGVVIPAKNSRPYLPAHLAGLREWLDLAAEVVVVDSFSTDGTVEYLRENLHHPNLTFASHPPGLYASWNHGISLVQSPWFYMATTGDLITRAGIERLAGAAQMLDCDIIISKPTFRDTQENPLPDIPWPIDDIISTLAITRPRKLAKLEAVVLAAMYPEGALLGSSASNLYRTSTFQRLPFPTDFGTAGDGVWGWMHAAEVSWGVVPERFSSFLVHPNSATTAEKKAYKESQRMDAVLRAAMESWQRSGIINQEEYALLHWNDLMASLGLYLSAKKAFDGNRRAKLPWILNLCAWRNRSRRELLSRQMYRFKLQILKSLA